MKNQEVLWRYLTEPGMEHLLVVEVGEWVWADGSLLMLSHQQVIRLGYMLRLDQSGKIRQVRLDVRGTHQTLVEKWVSDTAEWREQLAEPELELTGCLAFDIPQSLVTKSLALRQLTLAAGESSELLVASFDPTTLKFKAEKCRYTCLGSKGEDSLYRYENLDHKVRFELQNSPAGLLNGVHQMIQRVFQS